MQPYDDSPRRWDGDRHAADPYAYDPYGPYGNDYRDDSYSDARPKRRAARRRRGRARRRRRNLITLGVILALLGGGVTAGGFYYFSMRLPDVLALPEATTVYYADGTTVLAKLGAANRTIIDITAVPSYVKNAVVAAEDAEFWTGSLTKISRSLIRLTAGVKSDSIPDKARVAILSRKLEDAYSKDEILGFYLNTVPFGRSAYGIDAAAKAYFGKPAKDLKLEEAMVLAGVIAQPDGTYDPAVDATAAEGRVRYVRQRMLTQGLIDQATASGIGMPQTVPYDPKVSTGLDKPTGLVVSHALAELAASPAFTGKSWDEIRSGGLKIVTTIHPTAQAALEKTADETVAGSVMNGQPANLQAAAVVVEPGTGGVLAYFGGHSGAGADFAGWYVDAAGDATGYGAHPAGGTFHVYGLVAALKNGISVKSMWDGHASMEFPAADRIPGKLGPVRNTSTCPNGRTTCTLADATLASLNTPYFDIGLRVGPENLIDVARDAGIEFMWSVTGGNQPQRTRVDLRSTSGKDLVPSKFSAEVSLGQFPVTVLDQANAMATFAADGKRARAHFVMEVKKGDTVVYTGDTGTGDAVPVLNAAQLADLTWTLSRTSAGKLTGLDSAAKTGTWQVGKSTTDNAHAWIVGFTPHLAMAVWVGNKGEEKVIEDKAGKPVTGSTLPALIYRTFMTGAHASLKFPTVKFPAPTYTGDAGAGNARPAG